MWLHECFVGVYLNKHQNNTGEMELTAHCNSTCLIEFVQRHYKTINNDQKHKLYTSTLCRINSTLQCVALCIMGHISYYRGIKTWCLTHWISILLTTISIISVKISSVPEIMPSKPRLKNVHSLLDISTESSGILNPEKNTEIIIAAVSKILCYSTAIYRRFYNWYFCLQDHHKSYKIIVVESHEYQLWWYCVKISY